METRLVERDATAVVESPNELADSALRGIEARAKNAYWKARFGTSFAMMPGILGGLAGWFAAFFSLRSIIGEDWAAMVGMVIYLGGIAAGAYFGAGGYGRRTAADMTRLSEHADARAIKPLTDMVRGNVWAGTIFLLPVLRSIVAALTRILVRVRPEDRERLDDSDIAGLRSILTSCANHYGIVQAGLYTPGFIRTALTALAVLEDRHGVALAERLSRAIGLGRRCAEVRRIAQEALPALREAAQRGRERAELLRPADAPGRPEETLLRPVEAAPTGDTELLVRPVEGD